MTRREPKTDTWSIKDVADTLEKHGLIAEQEPCEDAISREQAIRATYGFERYTGIDEAPYEYTENILRDLPSVTPQYTDAEIQKMQEMEQAEIQKAYELGKENNIKVLNKIRAEIAQLTSRYTISRERGGMGQVEWSDRLIKESEVMQIIDKYKESEG